MTSKLFLAVLFGLTLVVAVVPQASADVAVWGPSTGAVALTADPYLDVAVVTTSVFQAHYCPCHIFVACGGQPVGYDCAEPSNCCHCYGPTPQTRTCVGN